VRQVQSVGSLPSKSDDSEFTLRKGYFSPKLRISLQSFDDGKLKEARNDKAKGL